MSGGATSNSKHLQPPTPVKRSAADTDDTVGASNVSKRRRYGYHRVLPTCFADTCVLFRTRASIGNENAKDHMVPLQST